MKVVWSPAAVDTLESAVRYIAANRPGAAASWAARVLDATGRLAGFPRSGRKVPEIGRDRYREILESDFRIIYRIDSDRVAILTVHHGRRLLDVAEIRERGIE